MTETSRSSDNNTRPRDAAGCPSVQALEYELAFLVRRLEAARRRYDYGLERAHYLLLLLLDEQDRSSVGALAGKINLDASTVTRQIAAMQRAGLVDKQQNPDDRRGGVITITDKGREAIVRTRQRRMERVEQVFRHWAEADRLEFARLMAHYSRDLSATLNAEEGMSGPPSTGPGNIT